MSEGRVIAAVRDEEALISALKSKVNIIFDLAPNIETLTQRVKLCNENGKMLFIHIDLAEGIGKDKAGLKFVKKCGADGILSTRSSLIKAANEAGLKTIQRTFIVDTQSLETAFLSVKTKPDMVEIMPGVISPRVMKKICDEMEIPVIVGGLIERTEEIDSAIAAGVSAVSTGKKELWNY